MHIVSVISKCYWQHFTFLSAMDKISAEFFFLNGFDESLGLC